MTYKPLMETTRFHDMLCEGRLSRHQAHRIMASFGDGALTWHCGLCIHPAALMNGMYEKGHDVINSMISEEAVPYEIGDWFDGHTNRLAYDHFDEEVLLSIGLAKDVEAIPEGTAYVQSMNNPEVMATK